MLGNLALALHDTGQAREILRSALTLAKKLNDVPTQNWVLSNMTGTHIHARIIIIRGAGNVMEYMLTDNTNQVCLV